MKLWMAALVLVAACTGSPATHPTPSPTPTPPLTPSTTAVPSSGIAVTDVTFVSADRAWVVGTRACGARRCTALATTTDRGRTWAALPAPSGILGVRFADARRGYAWGPQTSLLTTFDGGRTWTPTSLRLVAGLEVASGVAWAIAGEEPYPHVWEAPVGQSSFRDLGTTPNRSGDVHVHGPYAYVVGQQGAGPIANALAVGYDGRLVLRKGFPCSKVSSDAVLTVSTNGDVYLLCAPIAPGPSPGWVSTDRGRTWKSTAGTSFQVTQYAVAGLEQLTASPDALYLRSNNGVRVKVLSGHGFRLVGYTDERHAVALTQDHELWVSDTGGSHWRQLTPG